MKNTQGRLLFIKQDKHLLIHCKKEFSVIYKFFSDDRTFSEPCERKNFRNNDEVPEKLEDEFITHSEFIRKSLVEQINARNKSISKIENLLAQIKFLSLRFML